LDVTLVVKGLTFLCFQLKTYLNNALPHETQQDP